MNAAAPGADFDFDIPPCPHDALTHEWLIGLVNLVEPGQMGVIGAQTGGLKTTALANIAAAAAYEGSRVLVASLQMPSERIWRLLHGIHSRAVEESLQGVPDDRRAAEQDAFLKKALSRILVLPPWFELEAGGRSPFQVILDTCRELKPDLVLIDSPEDGRVSSRPGEDLLAQVNEFQRRLTGAMGAMRIRTILTSQVNRQGFDVEVPRMEHLAFTIHRCEHARMVLMIGPREGGVVHTVHLAKPRHCPAGVLRVARIARAEGGRLVLLKPETPYSPGHSRDMARECEFVNCDESVIRFAVEEDGGTEIDPWTEEDTGRVAALNRPYHGPDGWVAVKRGLWHTNMACWPNLHDLGCLFDLLGMAQFEPRKLQAPGTRTLVDLQPGQILTSVRMLSVRWRITEKKVRGFLRSAQADGLIRLHLVGANGELTEVNVSTEGSRRGTRERYLGTVITLCHFGTSDGSRRDGHGERARPRRRRRARGGHRQGTGRAQPGHST